MLVQVSHGRLLPWNPRRPPPPLRTSPKNHDTTMTPERAPPNLVEVFRSLRMPECDQQTLILSAVGIHSWTVVRGGVFVVVVPEESAALAMSPPD